MVHKQQLFLTAAGKKPVSVVHSGHWIATPGGRKTTADPISEVAVFLDSLKLAYSLTQDDFATDAVVGHTEAAIERFLRTSDDAERGSLFGFHETATEAFVTGEVLDGAEQDRVTSEAGLPDAFSPFCLSQQHWQQELRVILQWFDLLVRYGLGK